MKVSHFVSSVSLKACCMSPCPPWALTSFVSSLISILSYTWWNKPLNAHIPNIIMKHCRGANLCVGPWRWREFKSEVNCMLYNTIMLLQPSFSLWFLCFDIFELPAEHLLFYSLELQTDTVQSEFSLCCVVALESIQFSQWRLVL